METHTPDDEYIAVVRLVKFHTNLIHYIRSGGGILQNVLKGPKHTYKPFRRRILTCWRVMNLGVQLLNHVLSAGTSAATVFSWTQIRKSLYLRCAIRV